MWSHKLPERERQRDEWAGAGGGGGLRAREENDRITKKYTGGNKGEGAREKEKERRVTMNIKADKHRFSCNIPFLRSSGLPFLMVVTIMSPGQPAGYRLRRPLRPASNTRVRQPTRWEQGSSFPFKGRHHNKRNQKGPTQIGSNHGMR